MGYAALTCAMVFVAPSAWAHGGSERRLQGSLTLRSRAPLYDNTLSYPTGRTTLLRRHQAEAVLALSHVNTWAQMPGYFFDGEWSRLELRLSYGLAARTEVAAHWGMLRQSGGGMDGFIEGFHALLHITQSRRDLHPRNTLRVATVQGGTTYEALGNQDSGVGLLGPVLLLRHSLGPRGEAAGFFVEGHLQLPGLPEMLGGARHTAGLQALLALSTHQPFGSRVTGFAAGGVVLRPWARELYGMPVSGLGKFLLLGINVQLRRNLSLAAHYLTQDGMVETPRFWPMHLSTHEFVLGIKWLPQRLRGWIFEAGIIENSIHDANTPDFGITLATGFATG